MEKENNKITGKCVLDPELHNCPYFVRETLQCTKDSHCCFKDEIEVPKVQKRKEKWFEKYYR